MINEITIPVIVQSIDEVTPVVKRFTFVKEKHAKLPSFSGGSHITTFIEGENGLIIRPYSLTSLPDQTEYYQIAIRLSETSNGGSLYWHQHVNVGDKLQISYPKNHFPLSFKAKHHVFYAAGIGITPFLSMMDELKDKNTSFELHYAAKSEELCAFYPFIKGNYEKQTHFYFSNKSQRLTAESLLDHPIGTHIYLCGPNSFIHSFSNVALEIGYPKASIHVERFTPQKSKNLTPFHVSFTNGKTITVSTEQTLLEAMLENGIIAPFSCRVGRCGTCELKVVEGEVEHFDHFLSDEQKYFQSSILTCVSRAKSKRLVIEF